MYRVKLTEFEGPLDLLLFFIKRDELDIYDIPISRITKEFLEYLHLMASLDLEVAGDFIVMAATLMQIKVRMLLPRDETAEGGGGPARRARPAAPGVQTVQGDGGADVVARGQVAPGPLPQVLPADTRIRLARRRTRASRTSRCSTSSLPSRGRSTTCPGRSIHDVELLNVSVDEQMSFILDFLRVNGPSSLLSMTVHMKEKIRIVVTIIAMLEMTKNKVIGLSGTEGDDDILIRPAEFVHSAAAIA